MFVSMWIWSSVLSSVFVSVSLRRLIWHDQLTNDFIVGHHRRVMTSIRRLPLLIESTSLSDFLPVRSSCSTQLARKIASSLMRRFVDLFLVWIFGAVVAFWGFCRISKIYIANICCSGASFRNGLSDFSKHLFIFSFSFSKRFSFLLLCQIPYGLFQSSIFV